MLLNFIKLAGWQFSGVEIGRIKIFPGGNFPVGKFPGGKFPVGSYLGWEFSLVGVFRVGIVQGESSGWQFSGWEFSC